jgi:hypothetical protein
MDNQSRWVKSEWVVVFSLFIILVVAAVFLPFELPLASESGSKKADLNFNV